MMLVPTLVLSLLSLSTSAPNDALTDALSGLYFLSEGVVNSTTEFTFSDLACGYLEPENITKYLSGWGKGGNCPFLWVGGNSPPPPPQPCNPSAIVDNTDHPGGDLEASPIATDDVQLCQTLCCANSNCVGFIYAPSAPSFFGTCQKGDHCCFQKSIWNSGVPLPGIGLKAGSNTHAPPPSNNANLTVPPVGMRSAVPLGGLGAGSFELRGDGTVHEVTIQNAHPSGAAKYGVLSGLMLGVRVAPASSAPVTRALRTAPPSFATGFGVDAMAYSGAHPVSRLTPLDSGLTATNVAVELFAYSVFKPGSASDAAHPAVAFSLRVENTGTTSADVSLYLQLPFGGINDCDRSGNGSTVISRATTSDAPSCATAAANVNAGAWTFQESDSSCILTSDAPWSHFAAGSTCAVSGGWISDSASLSFIADGNNAIGAKNSPGVGDVTLRTVGDSVSSTSAWADDAGKLWAAFTANGSLTGESARAVGLGDAPRTAAVGATTATITVPAGTSGTVSIIFAWHFPAKDWWHENVGNFYANLWSDSTAVAADLAADGRLAKVVNDIVAHHSVFLGPNPSSSLPPSPLPIWLRDTLTNQFSHFRSLHYLRDGRLREYEANDCPDIDSVHNDYQRHLPYLWAAPDLELSKFREYAAGAAADGHINEYLGSFGLGPLDAPGGRVMADTTTLWIVELYEFWINSGDSALVQEMWPIAAKAIAWQIEACVQIGLPWHLTATYDIINFEQYNTSTFNSMVHLASMQAGAKLALVVGDNATFAAATAAFTRGQLALETYLWNSTYQYYRAYTGADALMGDTLYGQVVAFHHGLGWLTDGGDAGLARLSSHLAAEDKYNGNAFGIRVVTGRHDPPPQTSRWVKAGKLSHAPLGVDTTDDTNWQGAGPDWSYVKIQLARAATAAHSPIDPTTLAAALDPARRSLENYRSRLNDIWNPAGLTSTNDWDPTNENINGQSYITSHYGFLLVDYYLLPALTGQVTDIPNGVLTFEPAYPCPYTLPVLLQGTEGLLSCSATNSFTLTILFGRLVLPQGGLSVAGNVYAGAVDLSSGLSVSW